MKERIGIGIVGCGNIASFHCRAIEEINEARFIGCVSNRIHSSQALAERFGGMAFDCLESMLSDPRIDVVSICTPSGSHLEPAAAAARAGKHVIVEKPLEITLQRCDQIIEACERNGVHLATIFPSRFHQASRVLKQAIETGKFGRLALGDAYLKWYRTQEYYDSGQWRGTWALDGGGALMNQGIHSVDLLNWLMGPIVEVSAHVATVAHERIEVEDVATVSVKFASGALGVIVATTAAFPGMPKKIEIHGNRGSAVLEEEELKVWSFHEMSPEDEMIVAQFGKTPSRGGAADPIAIGHAAHRAQFEDFIEAIQTGREPSISGRQGRRSVQIILAIYESAKSGQAVSLD
jgi:UDP-N-acetyl-2-amino-2-deoxyglucuronate dehydrogenase